MIESTTVMVLSNISRVGSGCVQQLYNTDLDLFTLTFILGLGLLYNEER